MKILIAEDDDSSLRLLEKILKQQNYDIAAYMDGTEALAALQAPGAPRVAILDWNMPGMTGMEICRALVRSPLPCPRMRSC